MKRETMRDDRAIIDLYARERNKESWMTDTAGCPGSNGAVTGRRDGGQ